ncbi:MAG: hypothetical protein ACRC0X_06480 [Brevinema sp.]
MQKLQKSLLALSVLFVLGACATSPDNTHDDDPIIDTVLARGLQEAIDRVGSVTGLTLWSHEFRLQNDDSTNKQVTNYYFGEDSYKRIAVQSFNGKYYDDNKIYNNEVVYQEILMGKLSIKEQGSFTIYTPDTKTDQTSEFINAGYTRVFDISFRDQWCIKKPTIPWTKLDPPLYTHDHRWLIVKETPTELHIGRVDKLEGEENKYTMWDRSDVEGYIKYRTTIYKKQ